MANDLKETFDRKFLARLVRIARSRGIPHQDSEDLAHDVIADALRQIQQGIFRAESSIGTWLYQIVNGKVADYWRKKHLEERFLPVPAGGSEDSIEQVSFSSATAFQPDPLAVIGVQEALRRLSPRKRAILIMNKFRGFKLDEIAVRFRLRPGTVRREIFEAVQEISDYLNERTAK